MYIKKFYFFLSIILVITRCNAYDVYKNHHIWNINLPFIRLYSYDPYGDITILIKEKFRVNNMLYDDCGQYTIHDHSKKSFKCEKNPSSITLCITNISEQCIKTALFQNGQSAGYKLILTISAKIQIKNNEWNEFNITVSKSFFNNPITISANFVRTNDIRQLIYQEISEKLINIVLYFIEKNY